MKRLVFVLSSLLVLPAFAEVAPSYYDTDISFSDIEMDAVDADAIDTEKDDAAVEKQITPKAQAGTSARTTKTAGRAASLRTGTTARMPSARTNSARSRNISVRNTTATPVRTTSVSTRRTDSTPVNARNASNRNGVAARVSSINSTQRLYNANTVQPRGGATTVRGASAIRGATIRSASVVSAATTPAVSAETATDTTNEMNTMKALTEYCQAQYASCMDNYCDVLDDNQGRCTCSKNIANYEKTEAALKSATEALQDVARSIQYIGLSADQITTLFSETEAELSMKNAKDNSAIRSSLDKVKRMVVDVKSGTASAVETTAAMDFDLSGLLNFDIGDFGFDLSTFMNTGTSKTNSISNQRGESLYKTAVARCKASVLNSCIAQGVDAAVVTNSYDLEIDKSCLEYERALTESNTQMTQTVANAKEVLKKARLMVAQNKNSYDLRGCISALESCMQDDYVCGNGYEGCLDPTGQYIVNGSVVVGSMPGNNTETEEEDPTISSTYSRENLFKTWEDASGKNPWLKNPGDTKFISLVDYIEQTVTSGAANKSSTEMSKFLQNKIGWHDDKTNKDYGMCMSVLNQCQDYTYDSKGKYKPDNEVIKNFMQRALVQIKLAQDELLASYAEDCVSDVSSCLSSNNYDEANPGNTKSRTAINSCYSQIKTCMSVNGNIYGNVSAPVMQQWVTGTYSSIETVGTTTELKNLCATYTEEPDCTAAKANCLSSNGKTSTLKSSVCKWTPPSETGTQGTCGVNTETQCVSSN